MKTYFILLLAALTLTSCEKVIELDLKNAETQVVIEGTVSDQLAPWTVRVSQSSGFYESGVGAVIPNATVTIATSGSSTPQSLTYVGNGLYQSTPLKGEPGRTYTLTVTANGRTYTAASTLPAVVPIRAVTIEDQPVGGPVSFATFADPAGVKNYYRWVLFVNEQRRRDVFVFDDRFYSGVATARQALRIAGAPGTTAQADELKTGDTITVEMQSLDQGAYTYLAGLQQILIGDAATPANPTTNLSGGALGYFSAHSSTRQTTIVP